MNWWGPVERMIFVSLFSGEGVTTYTNQRGMRRQAFFVEN